MLLDVSKALAAQGQDIPFSGEVRLSDTQVLGGPVCFIAPARIEGVYASVGDVITLRGMLAFSAEARCARCLADTVLTFETPFDASFALRENPEDPDLYVYDGAWIDITQMAEDAAQLSLPIQWRCSDECKGLCPVCGADRNVTPCTCRTEAKESSLSALKQWLAVEPDAADAAHPAEDEREV